MVLKSFSADKRKGSQNGKVFPSLRDVTEKIVQGATVTVLEAIYEPTFSTQSYGLRSKRTPAQRVERY